MYEKEKWWQKLYHFTPWGSKDPMELNEDAQTVLSMRKEWQVSETDGNGTTIYQTPAGKFRAVEKSDGRLVRLELIEEEKHR